jgi:hypothetical protein
MAVQFQPPHPRRLEGKKKKTLPPTEPRKKNLKTTYLKTLPPKRK